MPRRLGGRRSKTRKSGAGVLRRCRATPQDVLIELSRLGFGLDAQLPPKGLDTDLVLAEGGVPPALTGVHPYQRSVHGLLERIQGKQASGRLQG